MLLDLKMENVLFMNCGMTSKIVAKDGDYVKITVPASNRIKSETNIYSFSPPILINYYFECIFQ